MRHRRQTALWLVLFTVFILATSATVALAVPTNNNWAAAKAISGASGTEATSNAGATIETGEVPPEGNTRSIWYKYTATTNDVISFDTVGSLDPATGDPLPLEVHVYTGASVSTLVELPESSLPGDLLPNGHVEFPITNTKLYYIAVTSPPVAPQGNTVLNWQTKGYTGKITGTVTATNGGTPLAQMQVDAYLVGGNGKSLRTVLTLADGTYELVGLGTGNYRVRFTDPAPTTYLEEWYDNKLTEGAANPIAVTNGSTTSGKNAVLDRTSSVSGNVKGNGANLANVQVQLLAYTGDALVSAENSTTLTNASGNYSFSGLRPRIGAGNYYIVQFIEPFGSGFTTQFWNRQSNIALATKLQPVEGTALSAIDCTWPTPAVVPGTLNGTVTSGGNPVSGVTVTVSGAGGGSMTTGADGTYTIGNLTPGTRTVSYVKAGYNTQWFTNVTITSSATTTQDVTLVQTPGTLSGTVTSGGIPVQGVSVSVPGTATVATTAANGTYSLAGITPGTYTVTYSKTGYNTQWASGVAVTSGTTTTRNVTMVQVPGTLSGTVSVSGGGTLDGVLVSVPGTNTVTTAGGGAYSLAGITPGTYTVTYSKTGYNTQWIGSVTVTSGGTTVHNVALVQTPGTLSGTVLWGGNGVAGVLVSIPGTGTVTTAANGTYSVAGVTPGSYTVKYSLSGYNSQWIGGVSITTGAIANQDVTLIETPGTLSGTVSDSNGPLDGVEVSVPGTGTVTTAGGGAYTIAGITPGNPSVTYAKTGYQPQTVPITIGSGGTTSQNITLVPAVGQGTLQGTVRSSDGQPLPGVEVRVPGVASEFTAADGSYTVLNVTPGTYVVTYRLATYDDQTPGGITITNGGTTPHNETMTLTPGTLFGTVTSSASSGPLIGVTVNVPGVGSTTTAANGTYAISNVPPKTYTVTYSKAGFASQSPPVGVATGGGTTTKNITLVPVTSTPVYVWRFRYEAAVGNYLWTSDPGERDTIKATLAGTWAFEGPSYSFNSANSVNKDTMWRFKNKNMWSYFYTADPAERAAIQADPNSIWQYEGATTIKIARTTPTAYPVWRFRCLKNPTYLWTADRSEMETIRDTLQSDYQLEGVSYWLGK